VEVLTSDFYGIRACSAGVKIKPDIKSWHYSNSGKIMENIKKAAPEIVHFQYPNIEYKKNLSFNILPLLIKKEMKKVKVVETFHDPLSTITILGQLRHALNMRYADGLIFTEKEGFDTLPFYLKWLIRNKSTAIIPIASNIKTAKKNPSIRKSLIKRFSISAKKQIWITFGFLNKVKGYEALFKVYDATKHAWIHLGSVDFNEKYQKGFLKEAEKSGVKINFTGFLPEKKIAQYLGAGDAVIFTFESGVSLRNGSFLAAKSQGVYIVAFHKDKSGYYKDENVYYVSCGNILGLKTALLFKKHPKHIKPDVISWKKISERHSEFYGKLLK
jgi:glycosyltransferase involved in cell wall biosynthesis